MPIPSLIRRLKGSLRASIRSPSSVTKQGSPNHLPRASFENSQNTVSTSPTPALLLARIAAVYSILESEPRPEQYVTCELNLRRVRRQEGPSPPEARFPRRPSPSIPMRYKPAALPVRENPPLFTPLCEFSRQRWWVDNFIEQASESARKEAKSDVIATSRPGGGPDTEITGSPPFSCGASRSA